MKQTIILFLLLLVFSFRSFAQTKPISSAPLKTSAYGGPDLTKKLSITIDFTPGAYINFLRWITINPLLEKSPQLSGAQISDIKSDIAGVADSINSKLNSLLIADKQIWQADSVKKSLHK